MCCKGTHCTLKQQFQLLWEILTVMINVKLCLDASSGFSCSHQSEFRVSLPSACTFTCPSTAPPSSLRGALLCNARCIRCIFIPHYFTPQRPLLETGDAAI